MHLPRAPLIDAAALALALDDPTLVILDVRLSADGGQAGYEAGHVPGAVFTDYAMDGWRVRAGAAPGLRPDADALAALLGRLGIDPSRHVVLVPAGSGANDLAASARIYWTLKTAGHDAVSILDGGWLGWRADVDRPAETGWREPIASAPYPVAWRDQERATAATVVAALRGASATFLDARSTAYFKGLDKAAEARRAGRLPGARSLDHADLFDPARHGLKDSDALARLFAAVPAGPVVSYCNTGHTAALNWFVLSQCLGRNDVSLYDGSMTEWTQDDSRPVETD